MRSVRRLAIAWAIVRSVPLGVRVPSEAPPEAPLPHRVRAGVTVAAVVAVLGLSIASVGGGTGLDVPEAAQSVAVGQLTPGALAAVGDRSVAFRPSGSGCALDVVGEDVDQTRGDHATTLTGASRRPVPADPARGSREDPP